ncbi:MAG: cellulase family glycosylhydrolase [Planctomycetaceae bacterium]|jgi:endoglucanase|nr:cellulase family glycosylhydrolase [Planctomycetaceae bacterium]
MPNRRQFLKTASVSVGAAAAAAQIPLRSISVAEEIPVTPHFNVIPRWRGFNLLQYFQAFGDGRNKEVVPEFDGKLIRDLGFNFVRLPMDYWNWIDTDWRRTRRIEPDDMYKIKEPFLENLDQSIENLNRCGIHVSLNLHRAPGYCVNDPARESCSLWKDKHAEDAFVFHWEMLAKRYKGISPELLSLNLVNEAPSVHPGMSEEDYTRVMARATEAIRKISPEKTVIIDGLNYGNIVAKEMIPAKVAQSVHAYTPFHLTHYRTSWGDRNNDFPYPTWPILDQNGNTVWNHQKLEEHYAPWGRLVRQGIGVHCGEAGCYKNTPHKVFLAWLRDTMEILKSHDIGYAIWEFRGTFGVIDSGRADVDYEDWHGVKLDREMLKLLI